MESLWKMVLLAVVSVRVFDTPAKVQSLIWVVIIAHTYNSFQINLDYFQTGQSRFVYRDWGFRGDNNVYSILTVPIFALTASVLLNSRLWYVTAVSAVACSLQAHQIMLMESRGCMLGCVIVLMVLVWGMPRNIRNIGIVLAGFLIVLVLAGPRVVNEFSSSFSTEENLDSSATSRFGLWKAGLEITLDYPLLGVGPKAGDTLVPQYMTGINMDSKALHNLIFEISTGIGIPALVLYLVFFAIPVALALSIIKRERSQLSSWESTAFLGVSSGIIGYWVSSMFSSGALLESSYVLAAIGLASISIRIQQKADEAMQVDEEALAPEHDIEPFPS